jgi:prophage regulatory protein
MPDKVGNMNDAIKRLPAVKEFTGLGKTSIYDGGATGTFPAPVKISVRAVGWLESDLIAWLETRQKRKAA